MEKMMKYPYIGEGKHSGAVFLFVGRCAALIMHQGINSNYSTLETDVQEDLCKNITHEYLQNTCGEVVSPEHAEFIIELAENAALSVWGKGCIAKGIATHFVIINRELQLHSHDCEGVVESFRLKQITIPLPPKADKEESSEWPQVGDEVTWGNKSVKGEVKALSDGLAWIKNEHGNHCTEYASSLVKPKTPEEELRDELEIALNSFILSDKPASEHIDQIINLFKKPQ